MISKLFTESFAFRCHFADNVLLTEMIVQMAFPLESWVGFKENDQKDATTERVDVTFPHLSSINP